MAGQQPQIRVLIQQLEQRMAEMETRHTQVAGAGAALEGYTGEQFRLINANLSALRDEVNQFRQAESTTLSGVDSRPKSLIDP